MNIRMRFKLFLWSALLFWGIYNVNALNHLIRKTKYGYVEGSLAQSGANPNIEYYAFRGIPYALPPTGALRFQEPLPPKKWLGVRNVSAEGNKCVQMSKNGIGQDVEGNEDCLVLSVYVPKTVRPNTIGLLPVLAWIHGGTFVFGNSFTYGGNVGPDYFMEQPIIAVTVHYRLNVYGFFSTQDTNAKGNNGLKDQAFALRWIQENIKYFGGNPTKVTIAGESAGGASVQYHMLSTKSKGLYQQAISMSGSTLNRWAFRHNPKEMSVKLAKGLGILESDTSTIVKKLQHMDYKDVMKASVNHSVVGYFTPYYSQPFAPSLESESNTAFITSSTYDLWESGRFNRIPYIFGCTSEEGAFAYGYIHTNITDINMYNKDPNWLIPYSMNVNNNTSCARTVVEAIKHFYGKNESITNKISWINYMSQELFVRGVRKTIDFMYKDHPGYFYKFSYRGSRSDSYIGGVSHHEELRYLWYPRKPNGISATETKTDELIRKRFVMLFANFVMTGNPTPKLDSLLENTLWPKVNSGGQNGAFTYLDIGNDLKLENSLYETDRIFWEGLFHQCGNPPYYTF